MAKGKKVYRKKRSQKRIIKKEKLQKYGEKINKKSLFNRYKNKQTVEQAIEKQKNFEQKIVKESKVSSESEEEEDIYQKLVSSLNNKSVQKYASSDEDCEDVENINEKNKNNLSSEASDNDSIYSENSDLEVEDDDANDSDTNLNKEEDNDPFTRQYEYDLSDEMLITLSSSKPSVETCKKIWPLLGNFSVTIPKPIETKCSDKKPKLSLIEEKQYATAATAPARISSVDYKTLHIKSQLEANIVSANKLNLIKTSTDFNHILTPLQKEIFSIINNYQDLYYPERSFTNADEIRFIYCLHIVNHMLKSRTKILHHNAKLSKKSHHACDEYRDQGLVRPRIIILVPFKNAAYKIVKTLIDILMLKDAGQVINKNRFEEDFTGEELMMPKKNPKPDDYELLFSGNTDDTFRLGMTITKKSLKLYTDFYSSDIIIASPLGLRIVIGAEGEEDRDYDFLASAEMLVMDQADVFLMQNWEHILHTLDHFHLQPRKTHNTDFSRVRSWAVNGWSKYYRQTLIFSSVLLPELKSVITKKCHNYSGRVMVQNPAQIGTIQQIVVQMPLIFHRFNTSGALASIEDRFRTFTKDVLPKYRDPLMSHTLIYVPSYFDYVRLRNYFKKEDLSFVQICEYSKDAKIARARDMFFHTEAHFLLYSERVHFFRRFRLKGIRHIIFYQLPTYPHFYSEMCNLMQSCNQNKYGGSEFNMSALGLYCELDAARTAAILGAPRAANLMAADHHIHSLHHRTH